MTTSVVLDRDEYVEQAYLFRAFRDRLADNLPAQDILTRVHEELLSSTRLPYAVQFLVAELKHSGLLASGFEKLPHYFTPFRRLSSGKQKRNRALPMTTLCSSWSASALQSRDSNEAGLVHIPVRDDRRNRLGYLGGTAASRDPLYDGEWRAFVSGSKPRQVGDMDFADLVYLRSELYVQEQRRESIVRTFTNALFGEKEGKIAKASAAAGLHCICSPPSKGNSAIQVPRYTQRRRQIEMGEAREETTRLETRLKLAEAPRQRRPSQFGKPDLLKDEPE